MSSECRFLLFVEAIRSVGTQVAFILCLRCLLCACFVISVVNDIA